MESKFLKTLGLCRRAGRLNFGFDMVVDALANTRVVFLAADVSARTRNSVLQLAARNGVPCRDLPVDMQTLAAAIGTKPVGVLGVTEEGFAKLLCGALENQ